MQGSGPKTIKKYDERAWYIYSRERLLIPISSSRPGLLSNNTCYIELDAHDAKRDVAVLYCDEEGRL